jgi:hypothetical protein
MCLPSVFGLCIVASVCLGNPPVKTPAVFLTEIGLSHLAIFNGTLASFSALQALIHHLLSFSLLIKWAESLSEVRKGPPHLIHLASGSLILIIIR